MDRTIGCISDLLTAIETSGYHDQEHAHIRFWYRGHAKSGWDLAPGVYRPDFLRAAGNDRDRLKIEKHLNQDFRVESAGVRPGGETDAELYFLQQHYGLPTRLLDWSNVPIAALYFAVSDSRFDNENGEFFMMDVYNLSIDPDTGKSRGIAVEGSLYLDVVLRVLNNWGDLEQFPDFIISARPNHIDKRATLQHSCFTLHGSKRKILTNEDNHTLQKFIIPHCQKRKIRRELALLGIDSFSIFGDLDHLAVRLKEAHVRP